MSPRDPSERRRRSPAARPGASPEHDPRWYQRAVFYELRVTAFQDSDDDGIGDFQGLIRRLDYLRDLGVTTLWLLPFYPSPLRDDGYDISDYENVHPDCGTLDDFRQLLGEAHERGLRVVTELVLNHTSDRHPWFQRARRAPPGSRWRDFYVWSDTPARYADARVIFKDFEHSNWSWDPVAGAYYWHRFYAHQPDLNFASADVRRAMFRVVDFWFGLGVDGLRLDAVPYLFEREGTSCENLAETHAFLKGLRQHVDRRWGDRMMLAEANQWPEDAVAYFGEGDECHMAFHFPLMPRLFMAMHMEDRFPIVDILNQTPEIHESSQWALFLRNHDELTLEMVTDEERDYMYRVYAHDARARINLGIRRRLAPLLGNDRRRIELMNALLFSLPGTPFLYYGDEIGMGDNFYLGDRNGVRTPMQWSSDRNAGFSRANPQRLTLPVIIDPEYHYESVNVEAQQGNPHSLLNWTRRLIALRKRHAAFGHGSLEILHPSNRKVLAFLRRLGDERILVVASLSRFPEFVELDLSRWRGLVPRELFGRTPFPAIGERPYLLTLGPHAFLWFRLDAPEVVGEAIAAALHDPPRLQLRGGAGSVFEREARAALEAVLPAALARRSWIASRGIEPTTVRVEEAVPLRGGAAPAWWAMARVESRRAGLETYGAPVLLAAGARAEELRRDHAHAVLLELTGAAARGAVLADALEDEDVRLILLRAIARNRRVRGEAGEWRAERSRGLPREIGDDAMRPTRMLAAGRSHTSIVYGDRWILKVARRVDEGASLEIEVGRFLGERARFAHVPALLGWISLSGRRSGLRTLAVLHAFVAHESDGWLLALDHLRRFFEEVLARGASTEAPPVPGAPMALLDAEPPAMLLESVGGFLETMRLLGRRVGELHLALASDAEDPVFAPEPFDALYARSLYQAQRNAVSGMVQRLRDRGEALGPLAASVVARAPEAITLCRGLLGRRLGGLRIRVHGDLVLTRALHTGSDFVLVDFEGAEGRTVGERRLKRSPLRDAASLIHSIGGAADQALHAAVREWQLAAEESARLASWSSFWRAWVSSAFLRAYLHQVADTGILPRSRDDADLLLRVLTLEAAVHALARALEGDAGRIEPALRGVSDALDAAT